MKMHIKDARKFEYYNMLTDDGNNLSQLSPEQVEEYERLSLEYHDEYIL